MTEKEKIQLVDFGSLKKDVLMRVSENGPMGEMESWKRAFPEVTFIDTDWIYTEEEIGWDNRTIDERAFYVVYMKNTLAMSVKVSISLEELNWSKTITEPETIWWMFVQGCFAGGELDETALRTLLGLTSAGEGKGEYLSDVDLAGVEVKEIDVKVSL